MDLIEQGNKTERILGIYSKLCDGQIINKSEEAKVMRLMKEQYKGILRGSEPFWIKLQ